MPNQKVSVLIETELYIFRMKEKRGREKPISLHGIINLKK